MTNNSAKMTIQELAEGVKRGQFDTIIAVLPDMYGRLVGKRCAAEHFLNDVAEHGMHACDYLLACDIDMDPVPGYRLTSWESGYGDFRCVPDLSTLRPAAWLPATAIVLCDTHHEPGGQPVEVSPRRILQRQVERAQEAGFTVMAGLEIEFYLFGETYPEARNNRYQGLTPSSPYIEDYNVFLGTREEEFMAALRRDLLASGIPVESSKGEWGPGQQELNIQFSEALDQADRTVLYKQAIRESALRQGKAVSFMAKFDESLAGCSMHAHVSLRKDARNVFAHDADLFHGFLAGWMQRAKELAPFFAPNVNSYKRYQVGSFAPTAIAWSRDNRTAGFRVIGNGDSLRIESRLAGADANPYLVLAAAIAAGLDGIETKAEPPDEFRGDAYHAVELTRVPSTLSEAIGLLDKSRFARDELGPEVVEHYLHFFRTEQRKFNESVTDWERMRYFERI